MATRLKVHFGTVKEPARPLTDEHLYRLCLSGREPAELLRPSYREELVHQLHGLGWTVVEIATHTRMTTYVTGLIHDRLGLRHNQPASGIPAGA